MSDPRRTLLEIFQSAVQSVNGADRVRDFLVAHPIAAPVFLIAIGKAACPMARGARDALGARVETGLVITKYGHGEPLPWPVIEAGHPVPDAHSLEAGAQLLAFVQRLPPGASVLVLLSGGASALVECLPEGMTLEHLRRLNEWILASGRDIVAANRIRKRLSRIKGGRLAQWLAPRPVTCLAISDVPGDDPRFIGSGPLVPDDSVMREATEDAPAELRAALARAPALPQAGDPCFASVRFHIVARLDDAKRAAIEAATRLGWNARLDPELIEGDAVAAGTRLAGRLLQSAPGTIHVWGGETSVTLPWQPGRGGRNQSLALAAAIVLAGQAHAFLLSGGTDGSDGPTEDAGALVDGATVERGVRQGFAADQSLARADAGSFLAASGDLIHTGPTATNVMDLILAVRTE